MYYNNIIIIPYIKHTEKHLNYFINSTINNFFKYLKPFKIVIIEQNHNKPFNYGLLVNIVVKLYKFKTRYFIIQNLFIVPNERYIKKYYTLQGDIIKLYKNHITYGIFKIKHDIIHRINGFPNHLWGRSLNDNLIYIRSKFINIKSGKNKIYLKILQHKSNMKNLNDLINSRKYNINNQIKYIQSSGINNLKFSIKLIKQLNDFIILLKVNI